MFVDLYNFEFDKLKVIRVGSIQYLGVLGVSEDRKFGEISLKDAMVIDFAIEYDSDICFSGAITTWLIQAHRGGLKQIILSPGQGYSITELSEKEKLDLDSKIVVFKRAKFMAMRNIEIDAFRKALK